MLPALAAPSVCTPSPLRYGYGPRRFLTTVTQAGRVMRYDYDSSGRVKQVTDPLGLEATFSASRSGSFRSGADSAQAGAFASIARIHSRFGRAVGRDFLRVV